MNLLVVRANNRPATQAVSSKMYETFLETVQGAENINVTTFDVFEEDMPDFGQDFFSAFTKLQNGNDLNEVEQRILSAKQKAKDALSAADVIVFAFPLWNFTIPSRLQTFIDYVAEAGYTFRYTEEGSIEPLMTEKQVILLCARGGVYSTPEMAPMEMAVTYMRNVFGGLFGMQITDEVVIEGHNAMPDRAQEIIQEGMGRVKETAEKLVYQNQNTR